MFNVVLGILLLVIYSLWQFTYLGSEREDFPAVVYSLLCGSIWRGFLFLLVLRIGCVISILYSLGVPSNYFTKNWLSLFPGIKKFSAYGFIISDPRDYLSMFLGFWTPQFPGIGCLCCS